VVKKLKVVAAPQTFKGSISALNAAEAISIGVKNIYPSAEVLLCPVADGGDGTLETLVEVSNGNIVECVVEGPTGTPVEAQWGAMGDEQTAVIEMARTSGLALLDLNERDPLNASTYGLGEAILSALDQNYRKFIIGIGGSATNDGGAGMAQAVGISLKDEFGKEIPRGGAALSKLHSIDTSGIDPRIKQSEFMVACDVNNPLTGPEGASAVYGPQKGATPEMITQLDEALKNFAETILRDLGEKVEHISGAGAAGGLGAGMMAFMGGTLKPGVDIVLDTVGLADKLKGTDIVITGEGGIDFQTVYDKAPIGVAKLAKNLGIPTIALAGLVGKDFQVVHREGIESVFSIVNGPMTLENASSNAHRLIVESTEQVMRLLRVGTTLNI
jgi:glycerate kinase